jgi:hypothetical protein
MALVTTLLTTPILHLLGLASWKHAGSTALSR